MIFIDFLLQRYQFGLQKMVFLCYVVNVVIMRARVNILSVESCIIKVNYNCEKSFISQLKA